MIRLLQKDIKDAEAHKKVRRSTKWKEKNLLIYGNISLLKRKYNFEMLTISDCVKIYGTEKNKT